MDYLKRNPRMAVVFALLLGGAVLKRVGVFDGLLGEETASAETLLKKPASGTKAAGSGAVNLRHFNWPDANLDELLSYSPFGQQPEVEEDESDATADQLTDQGEEDDQKAPAAEPVRTIKQRLKAVYHGPNGRVALVNSKAVSVGDRLEDGSLVLEIQDRHLVLQPPPTAVDAPLDDEAAAETVESSASLPNR